MASTNTGPGGRSRPLPPMPPLPAGPPPARRGLHDRTEPDGPRRRVAICCSGGGIRAAAFCLGGLQRLDRAGSAVGADGAAGRSYYADADFVTAVSGGSYIAAAFAVARRRAAVHAATGADTFTGGAPGVDTSTGGATGAEQLWAMGSAQDTRLRTHTRYLVEDKLALGGALLSILYGLLFTIVPLLALTFLAAFGTSVALTGLHILRWDGVGRHWDVHLSGAVLQAVLALVTVGIGCYVVMRMSDLYRVRPWSTRQARVWVAVTLACFAVAAVLAGSLIGVPALLHLADGAAQAENHRVVSPTEQAVTVAGTVSGLVPLVARMVGRAAREAAPISRIAASVGAGGLVAKARRTLTSLVLPWVGSAAVVVLFVGAYLVWASSMAWRELTVPTDAGMWRTLWIVGWPATAALGTLLLWQAVTDLNRDSLHAFYAARLSSAFAGGDQPEETAGMMLSDLAGAAGSGPALILCAAANTDESGVVATGRRCAPVTFSPYRSGVSAGTMFGPGGPGVPGVPLAELERGDAQVQEWERRAGRQLTVRTQDFELRADRKQLTVFDLVAVSGAAVAPVMGRLTRPSVRLLLGLANVGLGMWLPNPLDPREGRCAQAPTDEGSHWSRFATRVRWQFHQPGLMALGRELFGGTRLGSRWVYVTDGGHYENLGLVEALRRGATEVTVFDASGDAPGSWTTLGEAIETARVDLGVVVELDPAQLAQPGSDPGTLRLAARGRILFPDGTTGTLFYCKLQKGNDVPWDVRSRYRTDSSFPCTSTIDQFYDDREFEAYRMLGWCAAEQARALADPYVATTAVPESTGPEPTPPDGSGRSRFDAQALTRADVPRAVQEMVGNCLQPGPGR